MEAVDVVENERNGISPATARKLVSIQASGVFHDDAFEQLATSSQRSVAVEEVQYLFPLDDDDGVPLFLEQPPQRRLMGPVRLVLEPVDPTTRWERLAACRALSAPARPARRSDQPRQLAGVGAHMLDLIEPDHRRRRVDGVHHIVQRSGEGVDVFAIERRDEGAVQALDISWSGSRTCARLP